MSTASPNIQTIAEAQHVLMQYIPTVHARSGDDATLQRIEPILKKLHNPESSLRVIHVAGTSGKTSTAYYVAAMLGSAGKKIGLSVSPHIDSITERIQIDGQPISESLFCSYLTEFLRLTQPKKSDISYFELLTAFQLWVLHQECVEYAVVEVGIGGLYDATNVLRRQDKVCVITDIGFDHMELLGNSLSEIAAQKAGIIHAGSYVTVHQQSSEIMQQLQERADACGATLEILAEDASEVGFQERNWNLALAAYHYVAERDGLSRTLQVSLADIIIPGRMEIRDLRSAVLLLDGAHNAQKMKAFVQAYTRMYADQKATILFACKSGKEYTDVLDIVAPITKKLLVTANPVPSKTPFASQDPEQIAAAARIRGLDVQVTDDTDKARQMLQQDTSTHKIVTGSFYLVAHIRSKLPS